VTELIQRMLADDLASLGPRQPRDKMAPRAIQHEPVSTDLRT
jgi:hypothetical protein